MDRRWQLALDCLEAQEPPFSKGTFVAFRTRLIAHQMERKNRSPAWRRRGGCELKM